MQNRDYQANDGLGLDIINGFQVPSSSWKDKEQISSLSKQEPRRSTNCKCKQRAVGTKGEALL